VADAQVDQGGVVPNAATREATQGVYGCSPGSVFASPGLEHDWIEKLGKPSPWGGPNSIKERQVKLAWVQGLKSDTLCQSINRGN
jgi:hypothetical protein